MAYLFMFFSVAANTAKAYAGKKTSICATQKTDAALFSFVRIFLCVIIGLAVVFFEGAHTALDVSPKLLALCAFSGATNAIFLIGWMLAVQKNPLVFVDVSLSIGSIIPAILCLIFFGIGLSWIKLIGFGLVIVAALVLGFKKEKSKSSLGGILLVIITTLGSGLNLFSIEMFGKLFSDKSGAEVVYPKSVFLFYGYIFAALTLLIYLAFIIIKTRAAKGEEKIGFGKVLSALPKPLTFIAIMSVCLFIDNYSKMLAEATGQISPQVLYPTIQGACLVTVNFLAALAFGERPTAKTFIGTAIAIGGIVVMSIAQ